MKKMRYGSFVCEVTVVNGFAFHSEVKYLYDRDTVAYAVERFFVRCSRFTRECTTESWQIRIATGKARRPHKFSYLVPSVLMELPGRWVRISGDIDAVGINVKKVELIREHPCFAEKNKILTRVYVKNPIFVEKITNT